ncbi:MAG: PrpF family protein [Rhizobiaceae bacterium]|nr:PrpF family protein [Rhizobiaceae bacterium]
MPAVEPGGRPVRAAFMRGGTSKGLMFLPADLPDAASQRDALFLAAMGSPDPYGRQLAGMGGGVSSLSKVCVVGPSSVADADVDYTFGQVLVGDAKVDYSGNCGNMASAVGPFALLRGLVPPGNGETASIVIHNTNTGKRIRARFPARGATPLLAGDFAIDGVSGTGAPIALDFLDPGGSRGLGLLPTGQAAEVIDMDGQSIRVTLIDAATPCVFVDAADLGLNAPPTPEAIDADPDLPGLLERLRRRASIRMGYARDEGAAEALQSVPKIALVFPPGGQSVLGGRRLAAADMEIAVRMMSMGKAHKALPITGSICLAAALRLPGSVPKRVATDQGSSVLRLAHPSGLMAVDAKVSAAAGGPHVAYASVIRTARLLFDGQLYW